jgi:hypothetical protein
MLLPMHHRENQHKRNPSKKGHIICYTEEEGRTHELHTSKAPVHRQQENHTCPACHLPPGSVPCCPPPRQRKRTGENENARTAVLSSAQQQTGKAMMPEQTKRGRARNAERELENARENRM